MAPQAIVISSSAKLTIEAALQVACENKPVVLDRLTKAMLTERRQHIEQFVATQKTPAYGFNRGFGHNVDNSVAPKDLALLQANLIRSHSSGVGPPASREVVRMTMLLRAKSLAMGYSGVRPEIVEKLIEFLNADITPVVPQYGSVGASGDLAPLSHIAQALLGEGVCLSRSSAASEPTAKILKRQGITPLVLEMKEGLALINGVQFSTASGIVACHTIETLLRTATLVTAISNQVFLGSDSAYDDKLLSLRPHPGMQTVGKWLRKLLKDSPLQNAHRSHDVDGNVQDPYNLRCAPQILGTCCELISEAKSTFEIEANSVTDNPIILENLANKGDFTTIVSAGHFHGMPVAVKLYNLMQAMSIMATLSNIRCQRFVDEARNSGLGNDLIWPKLSESLKATSSGMMIPEYVSAALTNVMWGATMPTHLFSLSTDAGQEDHVSMSATLAQRVLDTIPRLSECLAIELAFATQAAAIRRELNAIPSKHRPELGPKAQALIRDLNTEVKKSLPNSEFEPVIDVKLQYLVKSKERLLSPICERALKSISKIFPCVTSDRSLSTEISLLADKVASGEILGAVPDQVWK